MQGAEYDGDLYEPGEVFGYYARGSNVSAALFYDGGEGTLIGDSAGTLYKGNGSYIYGRGTKVDVNLRGSQYPNALYYKSGDSYVGPISVKLYYDGGTESYYKGNGSSGYLRGDEVDDVYYKGNAVRLRGSEYENTVFLNGGYHEVTLQGEKTTRKLHIPGQAVTLTPAQVTTESVTALTV